MRSIIWIVVSLLCFAFVQVDKMPVIVNKSFGVGERVDYKMYLWGLSVGKGSAVVDKNLHLKGNRYCFKVDAYMQTQGLATWVSKVNDNWGSFIDTAELITHESYRKISEGPYRLNELIKYDHAKDEASVQVADKNTGVFGEPKVYTTPDQVRDVVAGFMYLRVIDFSKYKVKDTVTVSGFFEDKAYSFKILYHGKEVVKMDLGRIVCHKLVPIMPDNTLFRGENSVTTWISADKNQIPIKVEAKMFVGNATTELVGFRGLKNQFKIQR